MKEKESRLVYSFERGQNEEIQISVSKYKSRYYMDLRVWFKPEDQESFYPTKKGISVALDHLPELRKGLERVSKVSEKIRSEAEIAV